MHHPECRQCVPAFCLARASRFLLIAVVLISALPGRAVSSQRLVDDLGRVIVLPSGARRIIALDPTSIEVLYAVGAGARVVATSTFSNYPPPVRALPKLNAMDPSREVLTGLRPDLIVLCDQQMTLASANQKSRLWGIPIYVTNSRTFEDVEQKIARLGAYFGNPAATKAAISRMREAARFVHSRVAGRRQVAVFTVVWPKPLMTAGAGSFITSLISMAGGRDVAAHAKPYSEYPVERLLSDNPDLVLTDSEQLEPTRRALSGLHLRAIADGRLCAYPDDLVSRAGPRLGDGLIAIAKLIHPEAFSSK
ncbi:MAG: helical backbone metal receptor [Capsulimonadaceae bacterium]|nr:helical backbone metal receptor [Capsulimonadaceae bacterium]